MAAGIRVRGLTKRYGAVEVLRGVDLEVRPGEIFGLLGLNGSGKTTLLECLLGLRRPDGGSIEIAGIDVLESPERVKPLVGAQLQSMALPDVVTVREAVGLFGSFYARAAEPGALLARFGLAEQARTRFGALSGGQRQRLALALAFVNEPDLVVLDEPTASLDPRARRELHDVLRGARAAGRTILASTHLLEEAQDLCDRVAVLDGGRVVAVDTPTGLIAGAGCVDRVVVRPRRELDPAALRALPGAVDCARVGEVWEVATRQAEATASALLALLVRAGDAPLEFALRPATLADAFERLTGRVWTAEDPT